MYFVGYSLMMLTVWAPEVLGRNGSSKKLIIPLSVIAQLLTDVFPQKYYCSLISFFLIGITKVKTPFMVQNATDQFPRAHVSKASGVINLLITIHGLLFCVSMTIFPKNAVSYVTYFSLVYLFPISLYCLITVESPKWLILKHRMPEAVQAFRYIAKVNRLLSFSKVYKQRILENSLKYFDDERTIIHLSDPSLPLAPSTEKQETLSLLRDLVTRHKLLFVNLFLAFGHQSQMYYFINYMFQRQLQSPQKSE